MRRILRRALAAAAAGAAAAIAGLLLGVDRRDLVLDTLLVYLALVAAATVAGTGAGVLPSQRGVVRRALERRPLPDAAPDSLGRIEGLVALALASRLDFHVRLRPLLVEAAAAGLASSAGGSPAGLSADAEPAFSPATWELLRPDRPRPEGAGRQGIDAAALRAALDELESILPP